MADPFLTGFPTLGTSTTTKPAQTSAGQTTDPYKMLPGSGGGTSASKSGLADLTSFLTPTEPEPESVGGFFKAVGRGWDQMQLMADFAVGAAYDFLGWDEWAQDKYEDAAGELEQIQANPAAVPSYTDVIEAFDESFWDGIGSSMMYVLEGAGEMAPALVTTLGVGGLTSKAAKSLVMPIAKKKAAALIESRAAQLVAQGATEQAAIQTAGKQLMIELAKKETQTKLIGGVAGAFGASTFLETGAIAAEQYSTTGRTDLPTALGFGAAAASLDVVPQFRLLRRAIGDGPAEAVKKSLVRRLGEEGAKNFLLEGSTEALQTFIEKAGVAAVDPTFNIFSEEAIDEAIDAFFKGGAAGGAVGTAFDVMFNNSNTSNTGNPITTGQIPPAKMTPDHQGGPVLGESSLGQKAQEKLNQTSGQPVVSFKVNSKRYGTNKAAIQFNTQEEADLFRLGALLESDNTPDKNFMQKVAATYGVENIDKKARLFFRQNKAQLKGKSADDLKTAIPTVDYNKNVLRYLDRPTPRANDKVYMESLKPDEKADEYIYRYLEKYGLTDKIEDMLAQGKSNKQIVEQLSKDNALKNFRYLATQSNRSQEWLAKRLATTVRNKLNIPLPGNRLQFSEWLEKYNKHTGLSLKPPKAKGKKNQEIKPAGIQTAQEGISFLSPTRNLQPGPELTVNPDRVNFSTDNTRVPGVQLAPPYGEGKLDPTTRRKQRDLSDQGIENILSEQELNVRGADRPTVPESSDDTNPLLRFYTVADNNGVVVLSTSPVMGKDTPTEFYDIPFAQLQDFRISNYSHDKLTNQDFFTIKREILDKITKKKPPYEVTIAPNSAFVSHLLEKYVAVFGDAPMAASEWSSFLNKSKNYLVSPAELRYYGFDNPVKIKEQLGENPTPKDMLNYMRLHEFEAYSETTYTFSPFQQTGKLAEINFNFTNPILTRHLGPDDSHFIMQVKGEVIRKEGGEMEYHIKDLDGIESMMSSFQGREILARSLIRHIASLGFDKIIIDDTYSNNLFVRSVKTVQEYLQSLPKQGKQIKAKPREVYITPDLVGAVFTVQPNYAAYAVLQQRYGTFSPMVQAWIQKRIDMINPELRPLIFTHRNPNDLAGTSHSDGRIEMGMAAHAYAFSEPSERGVILEDLAMHEAQHAFSWHKMWTDDEIKILASPPYQEKLLYLIQKAAEDGAPAISGAFVNETTVTEFVNNNLMRKTSKDAKKFKMANQYGMDANEVISYALAAFNWYYSNNLNVPINMNELFAKRIVEMHSLSADAQQLFENILAEGDNLILAFLSGRMANRKPNPPSVYSLVDYRQVMEQAAAAQWSFGKNVKAFKNWLQKSTNKNSFGIPKTLFGVVPVGKERPPSNVGWHVGSIRHVDERWSNLPLEERNNFVVWPMTTNVNSTVRVNKSDLTSPETMLDALTLGKGNEENSHIFSPEDFGKILKQIDGVKPETAWEKIRDAIKEKGYNAVVYESGGSDAYAALSPDAVREANLVTAPAATAISDKAMLAEAQAALLNMNKPTPNPDQTGHIRDMTFADRFIKSAKHIAQRFPAFSKVFMPAVDRARYRNQVASNAVANVTNGELRLGILQRLPEESRTKITKALELARRLEKPTLDTDVNGNYTITNPGGLMGTLSKPNEVITLTEAETDAVNRMTEGFGVILKDLRESILLQSGLDPEMKQDDLKKMIAQMEDSKFVLPVEDHPQMEDMINKLKLVLNNAIVPLDSMIGSHYIPFVRFGDKAVAVHQKTYDPETGKMVMKLAWFETFETKGVHKFNWRGKANAAVSRLRAQFPESQNYEVSQVYDMNHDRIKTMMADKVWVLDSLATLFNTQNAEAYKAMRDDLLEQVKVRGFPVHWEAARMIPGYDHDIMASVGKYVSSASTYAADIRYYDRLKNGINAIDKSNSQDLFEYASKYVDYVMSPQEEFGWLRNLGFMTFLGFNPSSAVLQAGTLPMFTAGYLGRTMGWSKASTKLAKNFTKLSRDAARAARRAPNKFVGFNPATLSYNQQIKEAVGWLWDNGYLSPAMTLEQAGLDNSQRKWVSGKLKVFNKIVDASAWMFNTAETISRATAAVTVLEEAYNNPNFMDNFHRSHAQDVLWQTRIQEGRTSPVDAAIHVIEQTFGVYGKETRPTYMHGPGAAVFQFQTYPQQMIELLARLVSERGTGGRKAFAVAMATLFVTGGLMGLPGAENLKDLIEGVWRNVTGEDLDIESEIRTFMEAATDSRYVGEMVTRGGLNSLLGADVGRRLALGNIPALNNIAALFNESGSRLDLLGVPGSIIGGRGTFMETLHTHGLGSALAENFMPSAIRNAYEAFWKYPKYGVTRSNGDMILSPDQIDDRDMLLKALGFNSTKVAMAREATRAMTRAARAVTDRQSRYYDTLSDIYVNMRRANRAGDKEEAERLRAEARALRQEIAAENKNRSQYEKILIDNTYLQQLVNRKMRGMSAVIQLSPKKSRQEMQRLDELYNWRIQND